MTSKRECKAVSILKLPGHRFPKARVLPFVVSSTSSAVYAWWCNSSFVSSCETSTKNEWFWEGKEDSRHSLMCECRVDPVMCEIFHNLV